MNELFFTEKVRVADLVPHVANPRKIKAEEKRKLWERLQKFGMIGIPVRDADGTLLSGNRRCEVIVANGLGDMIIDVRTASRKLTDPELKEVMIIENSHAGEWDLEMLKQEFDELIDLEAYGLGMDELNEQIAETAEQLTEEPELPVVAKFSEQYNSIVIVCSNEIDFNHLSEKLSLDKVQCYKSSKVGMQRVVDAKQVIAAFSK
jgi:hypothetical protein